MKHYGIDVSAERRSTLPVWDIEYESKFIYSEAADTLYYGSDTGWVTVSGGGGGGGVSSHSALTELDYASANHTGFSPTVHSHTESNISDLDKYTQAEVDGLITTISGKLDDHDELNNLDYASAGHTGFAPTSHSHTESDVSDLDKYTQAEINTISGSLSSEIDSDISTHTSDSDVHHNESHNVASHSDTTATGANLNTLVGGGDTTLHKHDGQYYTESEVDNLITTISGKLDDHNELNNLDYASAGHTGFQPAGNYVTDAELTSTSGTLQTDIDTKATSGGAEHDNFSDFVANEHIDHNGVSVTAGTGLTGGGDITQTRTLDVDVGITDDKIVQIDDLDAASGDYCKLTVNGIEGRSATEVLSDLGADTRYRDVYKTVYIDAAEMIPSTTNSSLQGTKEYGTNDIDIDYLAFDGGAIEERAQFKIKLPENWDRLTIKAKFDWSTATGSTAGDTVEWGIKAGALSDNDTIDTALGTPQVISDTLLAANGADLQTTGATPAITITGSPAVNDMLIFEVYRNTDGTDDCAEDAHLFGLTLQYKLSGAVTAW